MKTHHSKWSNRPPAGFELARPRHSVALALNLHVPLQQLEIKRERIMDYILVASNGVNPFYISKFTHLHTCTTLHIRLQNVSDFNERS